MVYLPHLHRHVWEMKDIGWDPRSLHTVRTTHWVHDCCPLLRYWWDTQQNHHNYPAWNGYFLFHASTWPLPGTLVEMNPWPCWNRGRAWIGLASSIYARRNECEMIAVKRLKISKWSFSFARIVGLHYLAAIYQENGCRGYWTTSLSTCRFNSVI